jgi:hypothetical protein
MGTVATLQTKTGQYRILEEQDFQKLLGLARDVERLRGGLRVVLTATRAVQQHRDDATLATLIEVVSLLGDAPVLPTRQSFDSLLPENLEVDENDEVILDRAKI